MLGKSWAVRKRSSSSSGLMPASRRRKTLRTRLVAEDDRRVRLVGAEGDPLGSPLLERLQALDEPQVDRPFAFPLSEAPASISRTSSPREHGVAQGLVDGPAPVLLDRVGRRSARRSAA